METWKIITIVTLFIVAGALLTATAYAYMGGGYGGMMGNYGNYGAYTGNNGNYGYYGGGMMGGYGGGMMGGYGNGYGYPYGTTAQQGTTTAPTYQTIYPYQFGGGCHGGAGYGNGYTVPPYTSNGAPLNITTAVTIAKNYVASTGNPDLEVKEVEEYSANFYVQVSEKSTGIGAFELLVNKYTGSIYPEMGPNMMWNTKYGMMRGGILGGIFGTPTATMPVNATAAKTNAQQFLNAYYPATTVGEVTPFYGYYHVMVESASGTYGMLSVNGYTGQVWYHTWHGTFIQEVEVS